MKNFVQKGRKYTYWDFIRIPFQTGAWETALWILNILITALLPMFQTLATAGFIDTALAVFEGSKKAREILAPFGALLGVTAYNVLSEQIGKYAKLRLELKLNRLYRIQMIEKRARLEYAHVENDEVWDRVCRVCEDPARQIQKGFGGLMNALDILVRVGSLLVVLMAQVWWASFAIVVVSLPLFALALKGGKETYAADVKAKKYTRRYKYLQDVLQGRENVEERTMFGYGEFVGSKWHEAYEKARRISLKKELEYFIRMKGSSLVTVLLSVLIIGILTVPLSQGLLSIGMFTGIVIHTLNLIQMMSWQLSSTMMELAKNRQYLEDLTAFCGLSETEGALDLPTEAPTLETIDFIDVSFRYPGTKTYILRHLNLHLEKDKHYAFVGVNGAGKTTLTKLLTGLYDQFEGEIRINGINIHKYSQGQLKGLFAVVYQDFARYFLSARENIVLGDIGVEDEGRIRKVLEEIGLKDVVTDLDAPLGKIREGGTDLSGGEWQRLAIARALYNPAQVRILDEPTAALDPVAESRIYEMFGKISAGKSTIFITHRLGAARLADQIIVLDAGCVAEQGTHEELMGRGGIYARMFEAQRSWYQ